MPKGKDHDRPVGLSLVAKATLVLLLALGVVIVMRRTRAARRGLVLAAALAVLLALPVASIVAPPVGIDISIPPAGLSLDRAPLDRTPLIVQGADPAPPPSQGVVALDLAPSVAAPPAPLLQVQAILRTAWMAGAVLVLVPFLLALWRLHTLARTALPWPEGAPLIARLCVESGIRRHVALGVHERVHTPITFGLIHPTVLLPPDARDWPEHDLRRALVHELDTSAGSTGWWTPLPERPARSAGSIRWCGSRGSDSVSTPSVPATMPCWGGARAMCMRRGSWRSPSACRQHPARLSAWPAAPTLPHAFAQF